MTLLTPTQFREHRSTTLGDAALGRLLDAAEMAITGRAGPLGTITDVRIGGGGVISLSRRAASITSVAEQWFLQVHSDDLADAVYAAEFWLSATTLDAADFALSADGYSVQRLATGPHPAETWGQAVQLVYPAYTDTAERIRVQIELVSLDLASNPNLASQSIGTWSESYAAAGSYNDQREDILASLQRRRLRFA